MLDECTIAPVKTLSDDSAPELPVFLVQANLIAGGLLVTFNGQHGSMDVAGLGEVIRLLAKACRNEPFTSPELSVGNMNRKSIIPLFNGDKSSNEDDGQAHTSANERAVKLEQSQLQAPSFSWAYFLFSAASLGTLKSEAMSIVPTGSFVSTDDVLSVIVWQSINRARLPRLGVESSLKSTLSRNIDMRRYLSIPLGYPGLLTSSTSHSMMVDVLVKKSLGSLAADLRSALEPKSLADRIRASATQIENGGPAKANFASTSSPELDVRLSSWAKEKCYELDFGLAPGIGRPEAVRRPRFVDGAREGLVYFLPKRTDGEIVVGICLRDDDLEMLRTDAELAKYATHLG